MAIAILHDSFDQIGGAEKTILLLAKELNADIITTVAKPSVAKKLGIDGVRLRKISIASEKTPFKQFFTCLAFWTCDFSKEYDFFILSGRLSALASKKHRPNIYICMDLMREFYDLFDYYNRGLPFFLRAAHSLSAPVFRALFESRLKHIGRTIAVSHGSAEKIREYYSKDAHVIYPPINCKDFYSGDSEGYCLSVNRIYPAKRVELQLQAFKLLPKRKLVIVGDYAEGDESLGYVKKILAEKPENAEIILRPEQKKLRELYAKCGCFLATSKDEAFGMACVEAMASGKPVVAVNEGGFRETVIHKKTGFLTEAKPEKIAHAVEKAIVNSKSFAKACIARAREFDEAVFFGKMKEHISEVSLRK